MSQKNDETLTGDELQSIDNESQGISNASQNDTNDIQGKKTKPKKDDGIYYKKVNDYYVKIKTGKKRNGLLSKSELPKNAKIC